MNKDRISIFNLNRNNENNKIDKFKFDLYYKTKEIQYNEIKDNLRKNSEINLVINSESNINKTISENNNNNSLEESNIANNNKSKPTGINLLRVLINNINIDYWDKLTFKIHYGKKQFVIEFDSPKFDDGPKYKSKLEIFFDDISELKFFTDEYKIKLNSKNMRIFKESKLKKNGLWDKGFLQDIMLNKYNVKAGDTHIKYELKLNKDQFHKFFSNKNNIVHKLETIGLKYKVESSHSNDSKDKINNSKNFFFELKSERFLMEFQKFEIEIKNWNFKNKIDWMKKKFNIPNIKNKQTKNINCPIYSCNVSYPTSSLLKNHIIKYHPELIKNGIEIDNLGNISFNNQEIIDGTIKVMSLFSDLINKKIIKDGETSIRKK